MAGSQIANGLAEESRELLAQTLGVVGDGLLKILDLRVSLLGLGLVLGGLRVDGDRVAFVGEHQGERTRLSLFSQEGARIRPAPQYPVVVLRIEAVARVVGGLGLLRPSQTVGHSLRVIIPQARIGEQFQAQGLVDLFDRDLSRRQASCQKTEYPSHAIS